MIDGRPLLPIKIDAASNGEHAPRPVGRTLRAAQDLAARRIDDNARRVGMPRRRFLASLCGAATTLLTLNEAFAARGRIGGAFRLAPEAALEPAAAAASLGGDEFIFDVQTHMVDPRAAWRRRPITRFWRPNSLERWLQSLPQAACGEGDAVECFSAEHLVKEVFLDSDTS